MTLNVDNYNFIPTEHESLFKEKIDWTPSAYQPFLPIQISRYQDYIIDKQIKTIKYDNIPNISNNFTEMSTEIIEMTKKDKLVDKSLREILTSINYTLKDNYKINVQIEQDIEIPDWKEILIIIKLSDIDRKQKIRLWKIIEERARKHIKNDINKNIIIILEELDYDVQS